MSETTDFAKLPADITPAAFFELVGHALAGEPAPAGASADKLVIHVPGDGGGAWNMGFDGGSLKIVEGATQGAPLQVSVTIEDFRAFVAGDIRNAILARTGGTSATVDAKKLSKLFSITNKTEQVKAYKGDLQIVLDAAGKAYRITLTFGGSAPAPQAPTTAVTFTLDDFLAILGGELQPQAAFFAGKIRLDGDMNLAMGLMALAMG